MSASAPDGSASRKNGRLVAVCMSDTMSGCGASDVINHAALASCIQVPMLDARDAVQSARKTGCESGSHGDRLSNRAPAL
jgi:hypothetical protein